LSGAAPDSAMKRLWVWLKNALTRDDLFLRIAFLLIGLPFTGGGIALLTFALGNIRESLGLGLLALGIAILAIAWGALLAARCFVHAKSRIARLAEKWGPDTVDIEPVVAAIVIVLLPAVLLTIALRAFGINGEVVPERRPSRPAKRRRAT
jgi:hypothetical protein